MLERTRPTVRAHFVELVPNLLVEHHQVLRGVWGVRVQSVIVQFYNVKGNSVAMKNHEREWLEKYSQDRDKAHEANPPKKASPRASSALRSMGVSRKVSADEAQRRISGGSKQPELPMRIPPVQGQLALGFFTEPQRPKVTTPNQPAPKPPQRASRAVKAADDQAGPKTSPRGAKEPAGHVWWVSERWTKAQRANPGADETIPPSAEFELTGMQLENANGQNRGSMGAMHAHQGREKKRRQWALTSTTVNAASFIGWPVRITLVRVAPNAVDDDNLGQMFKRVRDGICEALGFRDDKRRECYLDWKYEQRKGGNRADNKRGVQAVHHVLIHIEVLT